MFPTLVIIKKLHICIINGINLYTEIRPDFCIFIKNKIMKLCLYQITNVFSEIGSAKSKSVYRIHFELVFFYNSQSLFYYQRIIIKTLI